MGHQGGKITDDEERKKYYDWNYNLEYNILGIPKPDPPCHSKFLNS
jgi:hypothetical protein